jgi:hypothetical protein
LSAMDNAFEVGLDSFFTSCWAKTRPVTTARNAVSTYMIFFITYQVDIANVSDFLPGAVI